jgi:transposase
MNPFVGSKLSGEEMLKMDKAYVIRHKILVEGASMRQVAMQMGVSRNTVKKYINHSEPKYKSSGKRREVVCERIRPRIEQLLQEWSGRVTAKQKITGLRILRQLHEEGYETGLTSVLRCLKERKRKSTEVFVPLVHRPGDEAQVDFFEVQIDLLGERRKAWMFAIRLMYSGQDFAWLYEHCDQVAFLDGHVRAFAHFQGVPARCVYDNLKPAVTRIVGIHRELSARFLALASHYLIEPCFARVGTGHDKGGIEARGKGIRWQYLTPIPSGETLDTISHSLLATIDQDTHHKKDHAGKTVREKMAEEATSLRPLPKHAFEARAVVPVMVSKQATVQVAQATYSVPSHWRRLMIQAFVGPTDIRFACRDELTVRDRVAPKQRNIKYRDYLHELRKKPQALRQVAPELLSELSEPFRKLWKVLDDSHGSKEAARVFAKVLSAVVDHGEKKVELALETAFKHGQQNLLFLSHLKDSELPQNEVPEPLRHYVVEAAKAEDFDALLIGGAA